MCLNVAFVPRSMDGHPDCDELLHKERNEDP